MRNRYEIWLSTDKGVRLALLDDWLELEYTIIEHDVGVVNLTLPGDFDTSLVHDDYKLEVWRQPEGQSLALETVGLLRAWKYWTDSDGNDFVKLTGLDGNDILNRRIIIRYHDSSYFKKTDHADDICKGIIRDQIQCIGASIEGISQTYFTCQTDSHAGVSMTKDFPQVNVMDECTILCETSNGRDPTGGTAIYWRVVPVDNVRFEFRTYSGQIGADRRGLLTLSMDSNNLSEVSYVWDATEEITTAYAGHSGWTTVGGLPSAYQHEDRKNSLRSDISVFRQRESFVEDTSADLATMEASADAEIMANLPRETFVCTVQDSEGFRYGKDYNFGDRMDASYRGKSYTVRVTGIHVKVRDTEKVQALLTIPMPTNLVSIS